VQKKRWKTCWCLLYEDRLVYYRKKDSVSPIGELALRGASVESRVPIYEDRKVLVCNILNFNRHPFGRRSAELICWVIVMVRQRLLKLLILCRVLSDFDETWYEWYAGKRLQSYRADFEYLHKLCQWGLLLESYKISFFFLSFIRFWWNLYEWCGGKGPRSHKAYFT